MPSAAAICAAVGISAEYVGKTAFANAKEITAVTVQAAAESEALLAGAERSKSVIPLCVGIRYGLGFAYSPPPPSFICLSNAPIYHLASPLPFYLRLYLECILPRVYFIFVSFSFFCC